MGFVLYISWYKLFHWLNLSISKMQKIFCIAAVLLISNMFWLTVRLINHWRLTSEYCHFSLFFLKIHIGFGRKYFNKKYSSWIEMYLGWLFRYLFILYVCLTTYDNYLTIFLILCSLQDVLKKERYLNT